MPKMFSKMPVAFLAAAMAGAALHFAYSLFPNMITAVFSPVNESVWEHIKLLFWPYLAATLLLLKPKGEKGGGTLELLSLLVICGLMLLAGYLYYVVWFGTNRAFGPVLYLLLMALGFALPGILAAFPISRWREFAQLAVIALGAAIVLFTFLPPDHVLFADLSGINTWEVIPW
jgi:hypothetical protein